MCYYFQFSTLWIPRIHYSSQGITINLLIVYNYSFLFRLAFRILIYIRRSVLIKFSIRVVSRVSSGVEKSKRFEKMKDTLFPFTFKVWTNKMPFAFLIQNVFNILFSFCSFFTLHLLLLFVNNCCLMKAHVSVLQDSNYWLDRITVAKQHIMLRGTPV